VVGCRRQTEGEREAAQELLGIAKPGELKRDPEGVLMMEVERIRDEPDEPDDGPLEPCRCGPDCCS
jgi:hypothetical protein